MRRTREFNVALRESPHRLQLWLDYAEFQEEIVRWVMAAARASSQGVAATSCGRQGLGKCAEAYMELHMHVCHDPAWC